VRVLLAIGLGFVAVLATLFVVLSKSDERLAGTNAQVAVSGNHVLVPPRGRLCQPEGIPVDTAALRVYAGTPAELAGPLDVEVRKNGRVLTRGGYGRLGDGQVAKARLTPPLDREVPNARICFRNRGGKKLFLAGNLTPVKFSGANPYGATFPDEPRVDYVREGSESWWSIAAVVSERFGLSKTTFFGSWTLWAVIALIAAAWLGATTLLLRHLPRG
jgi:hypothetical protein